MTRRRRDATHFLPQRDNIASLKTGGYGLQTNQISVIKPDTKYGSIRDNTGEMHAPAQGRLDWLSDLSSQIYAAMARAPGLGRRRKSVHYFMRIEGILCLGYEDRSASRASRDCENSRKCPPKNGDGRKW